MDRLRREYLSGLKELLPHLSEPADVADQLAQVSDDFLATAHELETLIRHRETAASQDRQAFDRAIDRASSELLRLSTLQRQAGDAVPTQPGTTIEDADGRAT